MLLAGLSVGGWGRKVEPMYLLFGSLQAYPEGEQRDQAWLLSGRIGLGCCAGGE